MNIDPYFEFPVFSRWASIEIDKYSNRYQTENPRVPPKKGVAPGEQYALSQNKHLAAVLSIVFGKKLKKFRLTDLLGYIDSPPSPKLFENWRSEKRFKGEVERLRNEFTNYIGEAIFFGSDEPLPWISSSPSCKELIGRIYLIREGLAYDPELIDRISVALTNCFNSKKEHSIENYFGFYIWCIQILDLIKSSGPKSRKRTAYQSICEKIVGQHYQDQFLMDYLTENSSPSGGLLYKRKWPFYFKDGLKRTKEYLTKGDYQSLQNDYREEFASIIKVEIEKLKREESALSLKDIKTGINFLTGRYKFKDSELKVDEDFDLS